MQEIMTFISHHPLLSILTAVVITLVLIIELVRARQQNFNISATQTTQLINREHAVVLDLRAPELYKQGHIINAQSLSAKDIQENPQKLDKWKNKPLIIVCKKGVESQKVAALLLKRGYNAYSIAGGIDAWTAAGMPIVKE